MSSSNNNTIYKKTSFLVGNNSEFINEFYADYISDPNSLPESWRKFFEGLSDDEKLVYDNLRGPSWSPEKKIKKPKADDRRERRLTEYEYNFLVKGNYPQQSLRYLIEFAIETGMRRGEILNIKQEHIKGQTLLIPQTKNGHPRTIPLTKRALYILENTELPFPYTPNALKLAWNRLKNKGNIIDLHFHDLRHEAISRFFEKGLSIPEVALISGHKDVRMLFRYTHLKAEDILRKL